jgi:hypothetical protein
MDSTSIVEEADHCSFAYSALAPFRMGISRSAPFHSVKKSWYAAFALMRLPVIASARPRIGQHPGRT